MSIIIELGQPKNKNKLATIDKIIQELENELIRIAKPQHRIKPNDLSLSVANLNSRIRSTGLSAYEQWIGRNQFTKSQIDNNYRSLIERQAQNRSAQNKTSEHSNSPTTDFKIATIVYIINEKSKHTPRPRYIIDKIEGHFLFLRKITDSSLRAKLYKVSKNACVQTDTDISIQRNSRNIQYDSSDSEEDASPEDAESDPTPSYQYRRSTRVRRPPGRFRDFVMM